MIVSIVQVIIIACALVWLLPGGLVLLSPRVRGSAKVGWGLLAVFFSWVGYAVFLIVNAERVAPVQHG
jgi:hypothetical protein